MAASPSVSRILVVACSYPTPESPGFGTYVRDQVEAIRAQGCTVDVFFINGRKSKWNYLWALPRFWWRLLRNRYDVIHAHYVLAGIVARAQWGYPTVLTHHGCEALGYPHWQSVLCHLLTPLFDQTIHVSEEVRQTLHDEDGWVIPCGIDLEAFRPVPRDAARARLGFSQDKPLVLWAGEHWRSEKRFDIAEQAMELVKQQLPESELVLLSGKPHSAVPDYMAACDALVLTSMVEGSPMVVKEAMACNLPIVSVRVGDVADVIGDTPECAIAARDPADLAARLVPVLQRRRRTDGRSRMQHLSHDAVAARVQRVYARAWEIKHGRSPDGDAPRRAPRPYRESVGAGTREGVMQPARARE
jgi:glycosyltransferase involved in cell wall biosynthesis